MNRLNRRLHSRLQRRRNEFGFTVLELLVVMGVVSLLVSLALPATLRVRANARRLTCMNHLRQISLAVLMNTEQNGRLPAAGYFAPSGPQMYHSWVTSILPQLDQTSLYQQYDFAKDFAQEQNFKLTQTALPVLACPDDVSTERGQGNLSYVVNGGVSWTIPIDCPATLRRHEDHIAIIPLDLNGNGVVCPLEREPAGETPDLVYLKQLSLFFVENWPLKSGTTRFHKLSDITDGLTTTLLLAENIRAGYDPETTSSWGSPDPLRTMFFVSGSICKEGKCNQEGVDLTRANSRIDSISAQESLNSAVTQPEGAAPWPSSGHPGLVNVAWCDGRVTAISETVDGRVYFALVTPQGAQAGKRFEEPLIAAGSF